MVLLGSGVVGVDTLVSLASVSFFGVGVRLRAVTSQGRSRFTSGRSSGRIGDEIGVTSGEVIESESESAAREREREMFYLTTHSTHFIYGYMASDIWLTAARERVEIIFIYSVLYATHNYISGKKYYDINKLTIAY